MGDPMVLLLEAVDKKGQAAVARELGYSPSAVNQILKGTYGGRTDQIMRAVSDAYDTDTVMCPVMGEITVTRCAAERKKPFSASSPQRAQLWKACRECRIARGQRPEVRSQKSEISKKRVTEAETETEGL
ncbi:MAG: helix-turn-helix domain-containing protein [Deltaproteobacteria bacterium]|nr:helix-turn-helix domain-containing protein [Deltaproteobacteria bacterium]